MLIRCEVERDAVAFSVGDLRGVLLDDGFVRRRVFAFRARGRDVAEAFLARRIECGRRHQR